MSRTIWGTFGTWIYRYRISGIFTGTRKDNEGVYTGHLTVLTERKRSQYSSRIETGIKEYSYIYIAFSVSIRCFAVILGFFPVPNGNAALSTLQKPFWRYVPFCINNAVAFAEIAVRRCAYLVYFFTGIGKNQPDIQVRILGFYQKVFLPVFRGPSSFYLD